MRSKALHTALRHSRPRADRHLPVPTLGAVQGTHESLQGNEKALATVTAIIDGMGSIGAALGPMLTGYISELPGEFNNVFLMLYVAALTAALLLSKLVYKEICDLTSRNTRKGKPQPTKRGTPAHKAGSR